MLSPDKLAANRRFEALSGSRSSSDNLSYQISGGNEDMVQDILYIILLSTGSIIILFILTKLMGYKQLSELSVFDYITGITIGSIAAEMSTSLDGGVEKPITAMIVYAGFSVFLSFLNEKSYLCRKIITGTPIILINNGKIYQKNLKKAKIDLSELLVQCRVNGYFDISKIQTAVLEENGKISFLPKAEERPVTPKDLSIKSEQEYLVANLIIDGNVMKENLISSGKDEIWLNSQLSAYGISSAKDVLLATCDMNNQFHLYEKTNEIPNKESKLIN